MTVQYSSDSELYHNLYLTLMLHAYRVVGCLFATSGWATHSQIKHGQMLEDLIASIYSKGPHSLNVSFYSIVQEYLKHSWVRLQSDSGIYPQQPQTYLYFLSSSCSSYLVLLILLIYFRNIWTWNPLRVH